MGERTLPVMIARLTGTLEAIEGSVGVVRPAGALGEAMSLEVMLPAYLARQLATSVGSVVTLRTSAFLQAEGQGTSFTPQILGFSTADEQAFFDLFTTVKGIGVRKALRALAEPPGVIAGMILRGDAKGLTALPEIGKRLAETIIAELKGKADRFAGPGDIQTRVGVGRLPPRQAPASASGLPGPAGDAVEVLVRLGEQRPEAERKVLRAIEKHKTAEGLTADQLVGLVFAGAGAL